jgi:stage V sporulation protein K
MLCKKRKASSSLSDMLYYTRRGKRYTKLHKHLKRLDELIGMEELKESVVSQIQFLIANKGRDDHFLNTVIRGPPGCGKTTVAEILYKIWTSLGVVEEDTEFHILHRSDFVGSYMGHTANKTRKMLEKYSGQVVFIDEAYSICNSDKDDYGVEALSQLNAWMSEEKSKTIVIIAGYADQLDVNFFGVNPGLERRFTWYFTIDTYTTGDLYQIFLHQLKEKKWTVEKDCSHLFKQLTFKNAGGDTENLAFKAKLAYSKRCWRNKRQTRVLKESDIREAIDNHFKKEIKEVSSMYI